MLQVRTTQQHLYIFWYLFTLSSEIPEQLLRSKLFVFAVERKYGSDMLNAPVQSQVTKGPSIWKALSLDARGAFRSQFKVHMSCINDCLKRPP